MTLTHPIAVYKDEAMQEWLMFCQDCNACPEFALWREAMNEACDHLRETHTKENPDD